MTAQVGEAGTTVGSSTPSVDDVPAGEVSTRRVRLLFVAGAALSLVSLLVGGFAVFLYALSPLVQASTQSNLYSDLREQLRTATAPVAAPLPVGAPLALIDIPSVDVHQVILESSTSSVLRQGPGHRTDTALPGQVGTSVILGRRATFGAPFAGLAAMQVGDRFTVTTGQGVFTYEVDVIRRSDEAVDKFPVVASRVNLVTSDPAWMPERSLIVSAALVEGDAQPRSGVALAAGPAQQPLQGDPAGALAVALWSQALLIVAVAGVYAWRRLPQSVVWVGLVPVGAVVLWNLYESVAVLLPNTL